MSPVRPENRHRYGPDWPEFSRSIRFDRAGGRCECEGECQRSEHLGDDGRCLNVHGEPAYRTGSKVVLTVAHLCHTPECREHVKAMCQGCHLHYDREHHAATRAANRAQQTLPIIHLMSDSPLGGPLCGGPAPSVKGCTVEP